MERIINSGKAFITPMLSLSKHISKLGFKGRNKVGTFILCLGLLLIIRIKLLFEGIVLELCHHECFKSPPGSHHFTHDRYSIGFPNARIEFIEADNNAAHQKLWYNKDWYQYIDRYC